MDIVIIWPYELETPNRARYQRIKTISSNYFVHLITMFEKKIDLTMQTLIGEIIITPFNNIWSNITNKYE